MTAHPRQADTALPPDGRQVRWVAARKQAVVEAVVRGAITPADAMRRWSISVEELDSWLTAYRRRGREGLAAKAVAPVQERLL